MNIFKTTLLLAALTLLLVFIGNLLGGRSGMMYAFVFALIMNFGSYWFSDKIVLFMYKAKPAKEEEVPVVYRIVRELAAVTNMPMPKIYIIPTPAPNAFATGRGPNHAVVAVTDGILRLLNETELKCVLAHEMAHVKHRDILISTIVATIAGVIYMLANMARWSMMFGGRDRERNSGNIIVLIVIAILAPIAAMLIQLAISRSREYDADEGGAHFTHNPAGLISALKKLQLGVQQVPMQDASPTTAHMFIVNPFTGKNLMSLFSTHPPMEKRIARLEALVGKV
jgi:heat shock protein HtpX